MSLIEIINSHDFCKQASNARYNKASREWSRRVKLTTGDENGDFALGEKPRAEYPRPQMERSGYTILNGYWEYGIISASEYVRLKGKTDIKAGKILVPFSPECDASGVGRILDFNEVLIYRTSFKYSGRERILLHFEAVDEKCEVFVNGVSQGVHEGGYLPFSFDVTDACKEGENALEVHVVDFTDKSPAPKGKQTLSRGGIWYTPQSGIWGTVWTEEVPDEYIKNVLCLADPDRAEVNVRVGGAGDLGAVNIRIYDEGRQIAEFDGGAGDNVIKLPGVKFWSPDSPFLYKVRIKSGKDSVSSYFAMRKVELCTDARGFKRVKLNGEYIFQSGVLDQGYYPEGMLTPPSDRAMINDIQKMKDCGFNMIRKHIKIEPARWYYHCDRLGMLVWQDMVSGGGKYNFAVIGALPFLGIMLDDTKRYKAFAREDAKERENYKKFVGETVEYLRAFPSIILWCIFNEGWGQFDSVAMTDYVRSLDPTRLIDSVSGWHDQGKQYYDFKSYHIYFRAFRMPKEEKRCVILSEFGGYSMPVEGHMQMPHKIFGYKIFRDEGTLRENIDKLYTREVIPAVQQGLCAAVYTQLSDVEEEINGILTYDRKVNKAGRELLNNINDRLYFEHEAYTKNYDRRVEEDIAAGEAGGDPFEE